MEEKIIQFFDTNWLAIVLVLIIALFIQKFAMAIVSRAVRRSVKAHHFASPKEEKQREDTLIGILRTALNVGIWILAGLLLLSEVGVEIGPLLAGAGVIGVALGFGAQSLVKDYLAGVFILAENQYRIGDVVQVNESVAGIVQNLTMRETVLRDLDGMVHHIPNGNINIATNMTMEFANVNLDVGVGYSSDLDQVEQVIEKVGQELAEDAAWKDKIIEAPKLLRVNDFADSAIIVKIIGKTVPMEQWAVTGELRKRLKIAFDKNQIEIPFNQVVIHKSAK